MNRIQRHSPMREEAYFAPGPALVPEEVRENIRQAIHKLPGSPVGLLEISHRSDTFKELIIEMETMFRAYLNIPEAHKLVWMPGGARQHYSLMAENLRAPQGLVGVVVEGHWSQQMYTEVKAIDASKYRAFTWNEMQQSQACYQQLQWVSNETVDGIAYPHVKKPGRFIIDASSDLGVRPIPLECYEGVYAGMQKAFGVAGLSVVILREDALARLRQDVPCQRSYWAHIWARQRLATPPIFAYYVTVCMLKWLLGQGGIEVLYSRLQARALRVYTALAENTEYHLPVIAERRSLQSIRFELRRSEQSADFLHQARAVGIYALQGHVARGGMRISLFHGLGDSAIDRLVRFLEQYGRKR